MTVYSSKPTTTRPPKSRTHYLLEYLQREPGSGIWWIRYEIDGVERRENVGRQGDAIRLYGLRKADALSGVKLPKNMKHKGVRFKVIAS